MRDRSITIVKNDGTSVAYDRVWTSAAGSPVYLGARDVPLIAVIDHVDGVEGTRAIADWASATFQGKTYVNPKAAA
jgi:hypothetical protein